MFVPVVPRNVCLGRKKYEMGLLYVTTSFPSRCLWGRASQILLSEGLDEQAEQGRQCQGWRPGLHLGDAIWTQKCGTCHISVLIPTGFSRLHPALVCMRVRACSPARGAGGKVTPKLWKPLFGNFIHPWLQPLGVSGTLQLYRIHSLWEHLLLSSWKGTELLFCLHRCCATTFLACNTRFSWGLQASRFAHLAGVCSLFCLLALLP